MTEELEARAGGDLRATVAVPGGALSVDDGPRAPDLSRLPGARMEGFIVAHAPGGVTLQLGCARAPGDRWVPGLEGPVLERATSLALAPLGLRAVQLERSIAPTLGGATALEAWAGRATGDRRLALAHALVFAEGDGDAVVCSAVCVEPPEGASCPGVVASLHLTGAIGPPPPPGLFARAVLWSADHPALAASSAGVVTALLVTLLLARRPRRPIASRRAPAARR